MTAFAKLAALALCGAMAATAAPEPVCGTADLRAIFSPCLEETQEMVAMQFYPPGCTVEKGKTPAAPHPYRTVPCTASCKDGEYYSPMVGKCDKCEPGYSSDSDALVVRDVSTFPPGFATYCEPAPCNSWTTSAGGTSLHSGAQIRHNDPNWYRNGGQRVDETVRSYLSFIATVVRPSGGSFTAFTRVESEPQFDGLKLYLNGTVQPSGKSQFIASGVQTMWHPLDVELPFGSTSIILVYEKDNDQMLKENQTVAGDRAYVRDIRLSGVRHFAPECIACPAGTIAPGRGATMCTTCPKNTMSPPGSATCTPCEHGFWSSPGSGYCRQKKKCQPADYVAIYEKCDVRTKERHQWWRLANQHCIPGPVPPNATQSCSPCQPGEHVVKGKCVACPVGQVLLTGPNREPSCVPCPSGSAALRIADYNSGFDRLGSDLADTKAFTQECSGECATCPDEHSKCTTNTGAFELRSLPSSDADRTWVAIGSARGNGGRFTSTLTYTFTSTVRTGSATFAAAVTHTATGREPLNEAVQAYVTLDDDSRVDLPATGGAVSKIHHHTLSFTQPTAKPTEHRVAFVLTQTAATPPLDDVSLVLRGLSVIGDDSAAAPTCMGCAAGHFCPKGSDHFSPCPAGHYAYMPGSTSCLACRGNSATYEAAAMSCTACPPGTAASADHTRCDARCDVTVGSARLHLKPLEGRVFRVVGDVAGAADTGVTMAEADRSGLVRFFFTPCGRVNELHADLCPAHADGSKVEPSIVCERLNESRSYSLGARPAFSMTAAGNVALTATHGDKCGRGALRRTNITFLCNSALDRPEDAQLRLVATDGCARAFTLASRASCVECTRESFQELRGPCAVDAYQSVSWTKRPGEACVGGFTPPAPRRAPCNRCHPKWYTRRWTECNDGWRQVRYVLRPEHQGTPCVGGPAAEAVLRKEDELTGDVQQPCRELDVALGRNPFTLAAASLLLLFVVLAAGLLVVVLKHRRLRGNYDALAVTGGVPDLGDRYEIDPADIVDSGAAAQAAQPSAPPAPGALGADPSTAPAIRDE